MGFSLSSQIFISAAVIATIIAVLGLTGIDTWFSWAKWLIVAAIFVMLGLAQTLKNN